MQGIGLTVFEGSRIDTFTVEVIGVQKGVRAGGSLLLVEVGGHDLENSSIAQGMSGSPIFIAGRFAGALAFGWGGALRPLAGVTPAREILGLPTEISDSEAAAMTSPAAGQSAQPFSMEMLVTGGLNRELASQLTGGLPAQPIKSRPVMSGFWPSSQAMILQLMKDLDGTGAWHPQDGPQAWFMNPSTLGQSDEVSLPENNQDIPDVLLPGSACAVPLITGDAQLGAIGTVTWVDGDNVFMMGHPFMQRGPVDLPLATARIHTIFPSRQISFKLGSIGKIVGTVHHDQRAGLSGKMGKAPSLVPVDLEIHNPDGKKEKYHFEVVDDAQLTPPLVFWTLYNSLLIQGDDASRKNLTYTIKLEWETDDGQHRQPIEWRGMASGPGGAARLSTEWMAPMNALLNNPFAKARLKRVQAQLVSTRPLKMGRVTGVTVPRTLDVEASQIKCLVDLALWHGETEQVELVLPLPDDLDPGSYRLAVANAAEMFALEAQRAPGSFQVQSLDQMIALLDEERAPQTLVVALLAPGKAIMLGSREYSGLPGRISGVIRKGNMDAKPVLADVIARQSSHTPWVVQGHAVRTIKVAPGAKAVKKERRP